MYFVWQVRPLYRWSWLYHGDEWLIRIIKGERHEYPTQAGARIVVPQAVIEGAGVRLKRSIATQELDCVDPLEQNKVHDRQ